MAQQGKQMRAVACKDFPNHSVKIGFLANSNSFEVDSDTFFFSKWQNPLSIFITTLSQL
jgi:hypothetical protein